MRKEGEIQWEYSTYSVIMQSIDAIWKDFIKEFPFHGHGVAIKPEDMVWVDRTNGLFYPFVKDWQTPMFWVTWLVDGVVSCNARLVLVMSSKVLPQPDSSILEIFVVPESLIEPVSAVTYP